MAVLADALRACEPGRTPVEIAELVRNLIAKIGAEPVLLGHEAPGVEPFPAAACVGVNQRIINAVPTETPIAPGDVVHLDLVLRLDGVCADVADSVVVDGHSDPLIESMRHTFAAWIAEPWAGRSVGEVSGRATEIAASNRVALLPEMLGHGIGEQMHESPAIPGPGVPVADADRKRVIEVGMILSAELAGVPAGSPVDIRTLSDGWTRQSSVRGALRERVILIEADRNRLLD